MSGRKIKVAYTVYMQFKRGFNNIYDGTYVIEKNYKVFILINIDYAIFLSITSSDQFSYPCGTKGYKFIYFEMFRENL